MQFVADLHIHSPFARACSKELHPEQLYQWSQYKGIGVLATGDFTHPQWFAELSAKLIPAEPGLFTLKEAFAKPIDEAMYATCRSFVRFLLGVEVSCIYKKGDRLRRIHHLIFAPSFEAAAKLNKRLAKIGNIQSDGRPILGLDSRDLLEIVLEGGPEMHLIPAHAWTPHFGIFGSGSGFDSIEECFEDLAPHIFAIETGLSSDPAMNWKWSSLDRIALISNSDAHSLEKLGREGNLLNVNLTYADLFAAIQSRDPQRFLKTFEFFPAEGKYHVDGHRVCQIRMNPNETIRRKQICPVCRKPVTVGVLHRVDALADRSLPQPPIGSPAFENIIPLKEILSEVLRVGLASKKIDHLYHRLLAAYGSEFFILRELNTETLRRDGYSFLALGLDRMRAGQVSIEPGYDGEYGKIALLHPEDFSEEKQLLLL